MEHPPKAGANHSSAACDAAERTNRLTTMPTTVVFVDIVDSIDRFVRLGNQAAKELIDDFFNDLLSSQRGK